MRAQAGHPRTVQRRSGGPALSVDKCGASRPGSAAPLPLPAAHGARVSGSWQRAPDPPQAQRRRHCEGAHQHADLSETAAARLAPEPLRRYRRAVYLLQGRYIAWLLNWRLYLIVDRHMAPRTLLTYFMAMCADKAMGVVLPSLTSATAEGLFEALNTGWSADAEVVAINRRLRELCPKMVLLLHDALDEDGPDEQDPAPGPPLTSSRALTSDASKSGRSVAGAAAGETGAERVVSQLLQPLREVAAQLHPSSQAQLLTITFSAVLTVLRKQYLAAESRPPSSSSKLTSSLKKIVSGRFGGGPAGSVSGGLGGVGGAGAGGGGGGGVEELLRRDLEALRGELAAVRWQVEASLVKAGQGAATAAHLREVGGVQTWLIAMTRTVWADAWAEQSGRKREREDDVDNSTVGEPLPAHSFVLRFASDKLAAQITSMCLDLFSQLEWPAKTATGANEQERPAAKKAKGKGRKAAAKPCAAEEQQRPSPPVVEVWLGSEAELPAARGCIREALQAKRRLVAHLGDALAVLNDQTLYDQMRALPAVGLEALLESDDFGTDSESSVVLLLAEWMEAADNFSRTDAATRRRLCGLLRLAQCSKTYLAWVLPVLAARHLKSPQQPHGWFAVSPEAVTCVSNFAAATEEETQALTASGDLVPLLQPYTDTWLSTKRWRQCLPAAGRTFDFNISLTALEQQEQTLASMAPGSAWWITGVVPGAPTSGRVVALGLDWSGFLHRKKGQDAAAGCFAIVNMPRVLRQPGLDEARLMSAAVTAFPRMRLTVYSGSAAGGEQRKKAWESKPGGVSSMGVGRGGKGCLPLLPVSASAQQSGGAVAARRTGVRLGVGSCGEWELAVVRRAGWEAAEPLARGMNTGRWRELGSCTGFTCLPAHPPVRAAGRRGPKPKISVIMHLKDIAEGQQAAREQEVSVALGLEIEQPSTPAAPAPAKKPAGGKRGGHRNGKLEQVHGETHFEVSRFEASNRELRDHGATRYKNTGTIKCNMLSAVKKHNEDDASGSSKKGVVLLLALALMVAAAGCAAASFPRQSRQFSAYMAGLGEEGVEAALTAKFDSPEAFSAYMAGLGAKGGEKRAESWKAAAGSDEAYSEEMKKVRAERGVIGSPRKGKSQSSICCNSCCSNYKVNKKGVVSSVKGVRKGKLTAELAVTARKAIEMRQKAEEAKEVVLVSDSDSDAA
eukprot:XP_001701295.1 predicted protein [Chlamydomonas reinhardtii]